MKFVNRLVFKPVNLFGFRFNNFIPRYIGPETTQSIYPLRSWRGSRVRSWPSLGMRWIRWPTKALSWAPPRPLKAWAVFLATLIVGVRTSQSPSTMHTTTIISHGWPARMLRCMNLTGLYLCPTQPGRHFKLKMVPSMLSQPTLCSRRILEACDWCPAYISEPKKCKKKDIKNVCPTLKKLSKQTKKQGPKGPATLKKPGSLNVLWTH